MQIIRRMAVLLLLAVLAVIVPSQSMSSADADPTGPVINAGLDNAIPNQYIVGLAEVEPERGRTARVDTRAVATDLADAYGGDVGFVYSASMRGYSVEMSADQAAKLAADPAVEFVQQSLWVRTDDTQNNPPSWGLKQVDNAPNDNAYNYPSGAASVHVYNVDIELNLDHNSFEGRARSGWDFWGNDNDVNDCKTQPWAVGHGTHTAGTSSSQAYGVAKNVTVVGVRVFNCSGLAPDSYAIAGVEWVTQHAIKPAVANASWTSGGGDADPQGIQSAISTSVAQRDITWVVSAGNSNDDACSYTPAGMGSVITVAATAQGHAEAGYSNHGSCVDLYAPGTDIVSASNSSNNGSKVLTGTSMAAPHVTGAAALYLHRYPNALPFHVRNAIVSGARNGFVENIGPGSPNKFLNVQNMW